MRRLRVHRSPSPEPTTRGTGATVGSPRVAGAPGAGGPDPEEAAVADVLVVEDDDVTRALLEMRLRGAGHCVRSASSAAEARGLLHEGAPEVLVTDMFMPGGSGLGLVAGLREDPVCADLPVVFLSGRALPADVEATRALNGTFLTKPFVPATLAAAVQAALDARPAALEEVVRARLHELGDLEDEQERALLARLLTSFVEQAPPVVAELVAAPAGGGAAGGEVAGGGSAGGGAAEAEAHRLAGSAATLGAAPLARLCAVVEERARTGEVPVSAALVAPLHRELELTRRVFARLAGELAAAAEPTGPGA